MPDKKTSQTGVTRRAEQRKAVPYTVTDIGDKEALVIWKAEQLRKDDLFKLQRRATRDRAVQAYNQGGGHILEWMARENARHEAALAALADKPKAPWHRQVISAISSFFSRIWRNANFGGLSSNKRSDYLNPQ